MATEKKLTKKASSKIYNVVIKFQPKASKLITYDEAWEVIANEGNLEGEVETKRNGDTKFILYKNDEIGEIIVTNAVTKRNYFTENGKI